MSATWNIPETKKIKKLLIDLDLDQADISKNIGISLRMVSHVINGTRLCWHIRNKIADYLKVPLEDIFPSKKRSKAA